jgi:hypothetical protein
MEATPLQDYLTLCNPFELSAPWDFVPVDPAAFTTPADPAGALVKLAMRHSQESLVLAGLASYRPAGGIEVHPFLAAPHTPFVVLLERDLGCATTLMTGKGCVSGFRFPFFAALFEEHSYRAIEGYWRKLLLTATLEETILLRSLGFAAAPVVGVTELNDSGVDLLGEYAGLRRAPRANGQGEPRLLAPSPAEQARRRLIYPQPVLYDLPGCHAIGPHADEVNHVKLSLVSWSPQGISLDVGKSMQAAMAFFENLRSFVGLEFHNLHLWLPTRGDMDGLDFAVRQRDLNWAIRSLFTSLDANAGPYDKVLRKQSPIDLATAIEQLQNALKPTTELGSPARRKRAIDVYRQAAERYLVGPMRRHAQTIKDPFEGARQLQQADLWMLWSETMLKIREELASDRTDNTAADKNNHLKDLLAIGKQILATETRKPLCPPTDKPKSKRGKSKKTSRRFAGLDFRMRN